MGKINYCPLTGSQCNKSEPEILVQKNTFFLAQPFQPEKERDRRERAVKNVLREALKEEFSKKCLRVADKELKEQAFFCGICRSIQSSAYGIVDISGLKPNVLLELGMMFSLGKPVFVLVKKSEQEDLKEKLPSDITWMRVIPYEEATDFEEKLSKQIKDRPQVEPEPSFAEKTKELFAEIDPSLVRDIDNMLQEVKREQEDRLKNLEKLLKEAGLGETIPKEKIIEIPPSLEKQIDKLASKVERIESLVGLPKDPEIAFLRGNWHSQKKEYERAVEFYDWALTLNPDFWEALFNKGNALGDLGRYEESINCFDKVIKIDQYDDRAWHNKGLSLSKLGRWEEAKYCYDRALEINPSNLLALQGISEALLILRDFEKGLETAEKAVALAEKAEEKSISWFLYLTACLFKRENKRAQEEIKSFINYFRGLKKDFKVTTWDFSPLLSIIDQRLRGENKRKLLSLISLLKGEIGLDEFERRIKSF